MATTTPYIRLNAQWPKPPKRARCTTIIKFLILIVIIAIISFFTFCELQLNARIYWRQWLVKEEFKYERLSECFDNIPYVSDSQSTITYNEILPAIPINYGWDCYDFANSIRLLPGQPQEKTIFHTYWRTDLRPLGDKQLATLKSFFATQSANYSSMILWSNGDLSNNTELKPLLDRYSDRFFTKLYDVEEESKETPMENSKNLQIEDKHAYLDGDLIRLLVLYKYGGVWFDMDSLFIRDFSPLIEHEWVGQWDCFLPEAFPFNGAFMRFKKNSPYVCELLSEMANGPAPRKDSTDWGSTLYYKIFRRLVQNERKPFKAVPWCFTDPSVCRPSNSMPSAFDEVEFNQEKLLQVFAYHWHNQWDKPKGSLFRFLEQRHEEILGF
ncbi:17017_t:CDS:1 [Gigaspora rosea]|nr:17017_t:CDS:1 [Gigaspora rosea]